MKPIDKIRTIVNSLFTTRDSDSVTALDKMEILYYEATTNKEYDRDIIYYLSKNGLTLASLSNTSLETLKTWLMRSVKHNTFTGARKDFCIITSYLMYSAWCQEHKLVNEALNAVKQARKVLQNSKGFTTEEYNQEHNAIKRHEDALANIK